MSERATQELISNARGLVAQGNLDGAERLLADAARSPAGRDDAALNHLFGQVLHDLGKLDRAITHYRRSVRLDGANAELHRDLGVAYESKSWLREATECLREAVRLDPGDELAQGYLGRVLRAQGDTVPALRHFARAAWLKVTRPFRPAGKVPAEPARAAPAEPPALAQAKADFEAKRLPAAERALRDLIGRGEGSAQSLALLAKVCAKTKRLDEGLRYVDAAIAEDPQNAEWWVLKGELQFGSERLDEAAASLEAALERDRGHAKACAHLALVEQRRDRMERAEELSKRARELDPLSAHVNNARGYVLLAQERFDEADACCRDAIRLEPASAGPYLNLAHSLKERGRIEEAREMVAKGADRLSDEAASYCHLAGFEMDMGQIDDAIEHARQALMVDPGHPDAHMALANLLLLSGRHEEGWREYEWRKRYRRQAAIHEFFRARLQNVRQWAGAPLEGKRLLVHCEQALGEQILFSSCLPALTGRAAAITLLCDERLRELFARSMPQLAVTAVCRGDQLSDYQPNGQCDFWCALGSLPSALRLAGSAIPPAVSYLVPDAGRVQRWRERLRSAGSGLKVGISWRGGVIATGRFKRSMELAVLRPLLEVPGVTWISMQYTKSADEIAQFRKATGIEVLHWQEAIDDFEEHAALAAALDHRISVCNTLVHLSGAMGLRTWVLSPPATIWPYGLGTRMPWYPSVTIYRQRRYKDWSEPIAAAVRDLRALVQESQPR
ncbi:MAG TPA: tetratricopeptide repeat protein [Burkholderiales bacterium]|nr:tetratricopeptide repeat protein [Burkholderiales bacterium]